MAIPASIVPAFPYEGGLYWLIGETAKRHSTDHSYYRVLYGLQPEKEAVRAAALVCLFDRIEIANADHALPDMRSYFKGNSYYHPDLRLSMSYEDREWSSEGQALAKLIAQVLGQQSIGFGCARFNLLNRLLESFFLGATVR